MSTSCTSRLKTATPSGSRRFSVRACLLRCRFWKSNPWRLPPMPSPARPPGISILIARAPQSTSCRTHVGPARARVRSSTVKRASGRAPLSAMVSFMLSSGRGFRRLAHPAPRGSADDDLADLDLGGDIRVIGDVAHDLLAVGADAVLELGRGIEVEVSGGHEGSRGAGPAPGEALVDLVAQHAVALEPIHDHGQMLLSVVGVIEPLAGRVRIENRDAHHDQAPCEQGVPGSRPGRLTRNLARAFWPRSCERLPALRDPVD